MSRSLHRLNLYRSQFSLSKHLKSQSTISPFQAHRPYTASPAMASSTSFLEASTLRRSIYPLTKSSPIPDSRILDIVKHAARHVPSAFDSQTTRIVVLLGAEHDHFWTQIVWPALESHLHTDEARAASKGRIDMFAGAKGSILFFESSSAVQAAVDRVPATYKPRMPQWSEHTSAMHQYFLWTALSAEGLGANLQHYNPLVDAAAIEKWGLEGDLVLKAQLVFGGLPEGKTRAELAREKELGHREGFVRVFGA